MAIPFESFEDRLTPAVAIVGSGPSIHRVDLRALRATGCDVIAINDMIEAVPWATYWHSQHGGYGRRMTPPKARAQRVLALPDDRGLRRGPYRVHPGVRYVQRLDLLGLSEDPAILHSGGNSAFSAYGLARHGGAGLAVFFGVDLAHPGRHARGAFRPLCHHRASFAQALRAFRSVRQDRAPRAIFASDTPPPRFGRATADQAIEMIRETMETG